MANLLKMSRTAAVLMLAASMPLDCQLVFAEPDGEQDATVISAEQNETSAAAGASTQAADAKPAVAGVSAPTAQGEPANAGKDAHKPESKVGQGDPKILSTNPDDANKHPAWRKREANSAKGNLPALRRSMQQGSQ